MSTYVRVQFMVTREQYQALRDLARTRGISMSGLLREILSEALPRYQTHLLERQRRTLEDARRFVQALSQRYTPISAKDVIAEMQAMREARHAR